MDTENKSFPYFLEKPFRYGDLILRNSKRKDWHVMYQIAQRMNHQKKKDPTYFLWWSFDKEARKSTSVVQKWNEQGRDFLQEAAKEFTTRGLEAAEQPENRQRLSVCLPDGTMIGYVGFSYWENDKPPSDLAYFLDPRYEKKGYALEMTAFMLTCYFTTHDKMYYTVYPGNESSKKLLAKLGGKKIGFNDSSRYGGERDVGVITRSAFMEKCPELKIASEKQQDCLKVLCEAYSKLSREMKIAAKVRQRQQRGGARRCPTRYLAQHSNTR